MACRLHGGAVMTRRLLALACVVGLGCAPGAAQDPNDPWTEGAAFSAAGKADGTQPIVYSSAVTTATLAYDDGAPRDGDEAAAIFDERLEPNFADDSLPLPPWTYLRRMSALGYYGPVGPYGPLGIVGPLGGNPWNPELYISGSYAWSDWSDLLTESDGPLSPHGPLGSTGPLNQDFWSRDASFTTHLQPGGLFAVLGPLGPTGALGPLGPLGPIGAHGYVRDDGGDYWPADGETCHHAPADAAAPPCRAVEVEWEEGGERRVYPLFERYDEERARVMEDNDTSFMVEGSIRSRNEESDSYVFTSDQDQWVTVAVVPEYAKYPYVQAMSVLGAASSRGYEAPRSAYVPHMVTGVPVYQRYDHQASFDDFDLAVDLDVAGRRGTIESASGDHVDWIQVYVPAGTTLRASISLHREWRPAAQDAWWGLTVRPVRPSYRLYVVGSTEHGVPRTTFSGPHLREVEL